MSISVWGLSLHFSDGKEKRKQKRIHRLRESGSFPRRIPCPRENLLPERARSAGEAVTRNRSGFFQGNLTIRWVFCCRKADWGINRPAREKREGAAKKVPRKICSFCSGVLHSKGENSRMGERKKDRKEKRRESPWCLWCVRWD